MASLPSDMRTVVVSSPTGIVKVRPRSWGRTSLGMRRRKFGKRDSFRVSGMTSLKSMCPTFVYHSGEAKPLKRLNVLNGKHTSGVWCPGEDSNLHASRHTDLNRARLPIPPPGLVRPSTYGAGRAMSISLAHPFVRLLRVSRHCPPLLPVRLSRRPAATGGEASPGAGTGEHPAVRQGAGRGRPARPGRLRPDGGAKTALWSFPRGARCSREGAECEARRRVAATGARRMSDG